MDNLLSIIYNAETSFGMGQDGRIDPRAYDTWNLKTAYRGNTPLTQMTVQQVLDQQRQNFSLPRAQQFTAAGAVQIVYKTLNGLVRSGKVDPNMMFDGAGQDQIAMTLLEKRGLSDYQAGRISAAEFGTNIAKEWASMPVLQSGYNGQGSPVWRGSAYYGGVSTNPSRSKVNPMMVEQAMADADFVPVFSDYIGVNEFVPTTSARIDANNHSNVHRGISVSWSDPDYDIKARTDAWMGTGKDYLSGASEPAEIDPVSRYGITRGSGSAPIIHGGAAQAFTDGVMDNANIPRYVGMSFAAAAFEREQGFSGVDRAMVGGYGGKDLSWFAAAKNEDHFKYLENVYTKDAQRRQRMDINENWMADFAGAMISPDTILSMGVPAGIGYSALRSGGSAFVRGMTKAGAASGAFEVGAELARHNVSPSATFEEGLVRVGMATLLGGFIGGGIAGVEARGITRQLDTLAGEVNIARGTVGSTNLSAGGRSYTVKADPSGGRILAQGEAVPTGRAAAAEAPMVRVVGGEVIVNEEAMIRGYKALTKAGDDTFENVTAFREFKIQQAAEFDALSKKINKNVQGENLLANKGDDFAFNADAATKAMNEGETVLAGPQKGNANFGRFDSIPIDAKKIRSAEDLEEIVRASNEIAGKARDGEEFENLLRAKLSGMGYRLDDVLPQSYKNQIARAKEVAGLKAQEGLEKWRIENNKILQSKKLEFIARMTDSPYKRIHRNALSGEARDLIDLLIADGAYARATDARGLTLGPSVYARRRRWNGVTRQVLDHERELYNKYLGYDDVKVIGDVDLRNMVARKNSKRKDGSAAVTPQEWRNIVSKSLITGKKTGVPEMDQMVQHLRNANEEYLMVAREVGVIGNAKLLKQRLRNLREGIAKSDDAVAEMEEIKKAISRAEDEPKEDYFTRVFLQSRIKQHRQAFKENVVKPWMRQQPWMDVWKPGKDEITEEIVRLRSLNAPKYRIDELRKRRDAAPDRSQWERVKAATDAKSVDKRADEMIAKILDEAEPDELMMMREPNRPAFGRTRQFDIPNSHLLAEGPNGNGIADFIETDYAMVQKVYSERMGPAIEMARTFARPVDGVSSRDGFAEALMRTKQAERIAWDKRLARPVDQDFTDEHPAYRAALDKMGLPHVAVRRMSKNDPNNVKVSGETGKKLNGYYDASQRTMYIHPEAGIDTVYHEAFHAIWSEAGLMKRLSYLRIASSAKKFEDLLKIKGRYAKDWEAMKASGRMMPAEEEYIAKVFGYWSRRGGNDTMSEFVEFANKHLKDDLGDDAPQINLNSSEIDRLNDAFVKMRDKEDLDFDRHWNKMERDIKFSADRVLNRVARNPERGDNRAAGIMKNWAMATFLGSSGLNAVQETGMLVMRHGLKRTFRTAFGQMDEVTKQAFRNNADELKLAGGMMDVQEGTALAAFAETGLDPIHITPFERTMRTMGSKMFVWSGLSPFTARLKEIDAAIQVHDFVEAIDEVGGGTLRSDKMAKLARFGISEADAKRMAREPIEQVEGGHWQANTQAWGDEELVTKFRAAIGQANENTILLASAADKPIIVDGTMFIRKNALVDKYAKKADLEDAGDFWRVHSGLLSLPFSFWNYALAATNKIMIAGMDEPSMKVASGIASIVGLAYMNAAMRSGDEKWSEKGMDERLWRAIDQSGIMGVLPMYGDKFQTGAIGLTGSNPFPFDPKHGYMPSGTDALLDFAGAGPQVVANAVKGSANLLQGNPAGANQARWAMPVIGGHILLRDTMDKLVDGLERNMAGVDR